MNLRSRLAERYLRIGPALTRDVMVERDLPVPMADGTVLLADRWAPRTGGDQLPVALMRTPYGPERMAGDTARPLAERGFQVIMQRVRGTFGSGGSWEPFRNEREDGLATLDWVIRQPWFAGSIVLVGTSYLGYAQWAVADKLPPEVKAMIPHAADAAIMLEAMRADGLSLEGVFHWGIEIDTQERPGPLLRRLTRNRRNLRALHTIPLGRADEAAVGHAVGYIRDVLARDSGDPYWAPVDHTDRVAEVSVPVSSVTGWYDIFLPGQLRDFGVLQSFGRPARLTVGPWTHLNTDATPQREAISFGLAHARGEAPPDRAPVRLHVMGQDAWRDFESWPPPGYPPRRFHLQPGGGLAGPPPGGPAGGSEPSRYRYDPEDPTPAVGGVRIVPGGGRAENSALERRPDVLVYTTPPLAADTEVIGEVSAEIWFRSSLRHADVFVRLCDVDERGRSWNISDGLISLSAADEISRAAVRLWPTAYRFKRGHRIRVQVSSGSFPRYARNPGTGEPRATAARFLAADQSVYHDESRPSAIILPVREA